MSVIFPPKNLQKLEQYVEHYGYKNKRLFQNSTQGTLTMKKTYLKYIKYTKLKT